MVMMMKRRRRMMVMVMVMMMMMMMMMMRMMVVVMASNGTSVDILLEIKKGFNNPSELSNWISNSSQNPNSTEVPPPPCNGWTGVTCTTSTITTSLVVTALNLHRRFRGGILSPQIGLLRDLQTLDLSGNAISGPIPPAIFTGLHNLTYLDLSNNLFSGGIPLDWSNMSALQHANLHHNQLNGSIPAGVFNASKKLRFLRLESNSLSGQIPREIGKSRLKYLGLEMNRLTGPIPPELGNVTSLRLVFAGSNRLNGQLPESFGGLTKLRRLNLESNELEGVIPETWGNLAPTLLSLNLSNNHLIGEVPEALLAQNFSSSSFANNDGLCGAAQLMPCPPYNDPHPMSPLVQPIQPQHKRPHHHKLSINEIIEIIVGILLGTTVFMLCMLLLYSVGVSRYRRAHPHQGRENWFGSDAQAGRRQGKFLIFDDAISGSVDGFEDLVARAGFFDTAHVIGRGRFATTYRCELKNGAGVQMAVKVFKYPISGPAFEREMDALALINHKFLLPIKGYYSDPLEKAIIYEYLPKGTLYGLLHPDEKNKLSLSKHFEGSTTGPESSLPDWAARQRIAFGVAKALEHLHKCNIVHKDVTSNNILLEELTNGTLKLSPLLADSAILQLASNRSIEDVVEKPGYTAPEVLETGRYTEKSDVYSFGVVLLELISGKKPMVYIDIDDEDNGQEGTLVSLVAMHCEQMRARDVMDSVAWDTCPFPEYLNTALKLAMECVSDDTSLRPPMSQVAFVLQGLASNPSPLKSPASTSSFSSM